MEKYKLTKIENGSYYALISLLDYRKNISEYLKNIVVKDAEDKEILVDSALVSGINEYRFFSLKVTGAGKLDLRTVQYITPNSELVVFSNKVLSEQKKYVNNSVLSNYQVQKILLNL